MGKSEKRILNLSREIDRRRKSLDKTLFISSHLFIVSLGALFAWLAFLASY